MSKEIKETKKEMIELEKVHQIIQETVNAFIQQEIGNKITQFNMTGFTTALIGQLSNKEG